jgi:TolA-binding protein
VDNQVVCGVERIVERRYYVKKSKLTPKHDQLTSTTDLTGNGKKYRQLSGVSTLTATTTECSQCSSSTPTYVENLQNQSNSLRNEISGLKGDIEQLQTSQQKFFRQLQTQFQSKTVVTPTAAQNPGKKDYFLLFCRYLLFI